MGWFQRPPVDHARGGDPACDPVLPCRQELALLLGVKDARQVVLLPSATCAINLVINAVVTGGSHAVTSVLEHNSVLRPLAHRARDWAASVTRLAVNSQGVVSPADLVKSLRADTALIALTWASNVTGSLQSVEAFADIAAKAGVPLLLDASQAVGAVEVDYQRMPGRVFLVFSGHKGLLGPPGVGGLVVPDEELPQTVVGGTGIRSESELHPAELPLRHEAGTPNLPGLAGLLAGARLVRETTVEQMGAHRATLVSGLRDALGSIPGVHLLPLAGGDGRIGIVSFTIQGWEPDELAFVLRSSFGIEVRAGLHCAPLVPAALGVDARGTVRASVGWSTTLDDVRALVMAVSEIVAS